MTDRLTPERRSDNMRRIKSKNTGPERAVRTELHRRGFRYRLHRRDLPGCPDLTFVALRKVIFIHGCFWHQHAGCTDGRMPKTNVAYWQPKLRKNIERDKRNVQELSRCGWKVLVVWECELQDLQAALSRICEFLKER